MKNINQPIHISNITLKRHVSHSNILPLGPTDVLILLTPGHSHSIGMRMSRNLESLSQAYVPASMDSSQHTCASVPRIWANFLAKNPSLYPKLVTTSKIHKRHYDHTNKSKSSLGLGLIFPNRDWHYVKHSTSMQFAEHEYKTENKWLITHMILDKKDRHPLPLTIFTSIRSCIHYPFSYK